MHPTYRYTPQCRSQDQDGWRDVCESIAYTCRLSISCAVNTAPARELTDAPNLVSLDSVRSNAAGAVQGLPACRVPRYVREGITRNNAQTTGNRETHDMLTSVRCAGNPER